MAALNEGQPVWSSNEHLLADLWTLLVKANSDQKHIPDNFDHPIRAAMTAKNVAASKRKLKDVFLRKREAMS